VWQSPHFSVGDFDGFCAFDAWWHSAHLPTLMCAAWSKVTAPFGAGRTTLVGGFGAWANASEATISTNTPNSRTISL
jgi:hypothetical protein